ncbi:MAG: signal peptidase I [Thermoprotei archaeon]
MKKVDLLLLGLLIIFYALVLTGTLKTASVEGVSMYPIFQNGYLVFYSKPTSIHPGTIVIYFNGKNYVIHEVVSVSNGYFITKGVNPYTNNLPDNVLGIGPSNGITLGDIIGQVASVNGNYYFAIPYLGYLSIFFSG